MANLIKSYKELHVYQNAIEKAMNIYQISKSFPAEEKYAMTDQIRRCSRSVCANIAEGWRKRRYRAAFIAKLNDAEGEASETQFWLELAEKSNYIDNQKYLKLEDAYNQILAQIVTMIENPDKWVVKQKEGQKGGRREQRRGNLE